MQLHDALAAVGVPLVELSSEEHDALCALRYSGLPDWGSVVPEPMGAKALPPLTWRDKVTGVAVVGLLGKPKSGKDAVADHFKQTYSGVASCAFSDAIVAEVNALLALLGWAARITSANKSSLRFRRVLQDWGVIRRRVNGPSYWVERALGRVASLAQEGAGLVFVTGARSVDDVRALSDYGAAMWKVVRPGNPYSADHEIERQLDHVPDWAWDHLLLNETEGDMTPMLRRAEVAIHYTPTHEYLGYL